jgi:RepB DNA-primase from phage plasmid
MAKLQSTDEAEEFLRELGKGIPENERVMVGYADEATVQTDPETGKKLNGGWWPLPYKDGKYINVNANCYACISSSVKTPNPKTGKYRYWRGESSFGHGLALMVDDIGHGTGSKGAFEINEIIKILPPTCIIETSPNNFQVWYFLDTPCGDMRYFKAFLVCFVNHVLKAKGGDATIRDVSRYGRMPCGKNNKRMADGTLKYPSEFRVHKRVADYGVRYSIERIAAAFGVIIEVPVKKEVRVDWEDVKIDAKWLSMAEWILNKARQGEGAGGEVSMNMSGKFRIKCPWGDEHENNDPYGAYFRGGIDGAEHEFVFGCAHDTCRKARRTWSAFVDKVVMPHVYEKIKEANRTDWTYEQIVNSGKVR